MERVRLCGEKCLGFFNPRIPFLNKRSVLAWKWPLLEILKSRHIEINTKLSGRNIPKTCRGPDVGKMTPHAGLTGGFTWRAGAKLEAGSPHQVWRAGRETLTSSTQSQVPTLGLAPTSSQDVFLGAVLPLKTAPRAIRARGLGASLGALVRS